MRHTGIGVLFGCFGREIDGDSWFTWWFNHLPGPSISAKRTPMHMGVRRISWGKKALKLFIFLEQLAQHRGIILSANIPRPIAEMKVAAWLTAGDIVLGFALAD